MILCLSVCLLAKADDLTVFADNDRIVAGRAFSDCTKQVDENLELLIKAIDQSRSDSAIRRTLARFSVAAKKNDDGFPTSFSWVDASRSVADGCRVICVSYGPIGRVAIFNRANTRVQIKELQFMDQRHPSVLLHRGHSLVLGSTFVRDAGIRDNTRIQFVRMDEKPVLQQTMDFEHTLEWGGPHVQADEVTVFSIDSPKSFFVANPDPVFKHRRVFKVIDGRGQLIVDEPQDIPLRALDEWMGAARAAKTPNRMQQVLRKYLPEMEMIDSHVVKTYGDGSVAVTMIGNQAEVRFALKPRGKSYVVTKVQGKVVS